MSETHHTVQTEHGVDAPRDAPDADSIALELDGVTKRYGTETAVEDVSLAVREGELFTLLGPSGCGKTTTLRLLAGLEGPTEGTVSIAGAAVADAERASPPNERDVGLVFQDFALFPHLTVAENVAYGIPDASDGERTERVTSLLELVDLAGFEERDPSELSGGQQQRVALARALVNEPALVLFDEPLSSLDRKLRQHMQTELQRIQTETDTTFLYVTHDQEVALAVSDRLVVLDGGRIQQVGTVEDLYEAPESKFVADFIGDVNAVEGRVTAVEDGGVTVDAGTGEVRVPRDAAGDVDVGDAVDVCVRPFQVRVEGGERADGGDGTFWTTGVVRNRSYQGSDSLYGVETDAWGRLSAEVRADSFEIGESVTVAWDAADVHLYRREETPASEPEAA